MRTNIRAEFINLNNSIISLTELQKNELVMCMKEKTFSKGEFLWKKGEQCLGCYIVFSGTFQVYDIPHNVNNLKESQDVTYKGNLIGDFPSLTTDE